MNRHRYIVFGVLPVIGVLLLRADNVALAQSKDPFAGTWILSRGKSDFDPPSFFFSRTLIIESIENGHKCIIRTVSDRRQTIESSYEAGFDGKDVPIENSQLDTVSLRRIDANTLERSGKIKGQVVETATMKLSEAGKVLTILTKGSTGGQAYTSTQVFNRQ
jgi:hypothetical protein